jgi:hypothetical protein
MRKHVVWGVLALMVAGAAAPAVAEEGKGTGIKISGYLAPNFRMYDQGAGNASNVGFGMAFNRFCFSGSHDIESVIKKITWEVETDISRTSAFKLQWIYIQPHFNDTFSLRFGRMKKPQSREVLHPTNKLLTVNRHTNLDYVPLGYAGYSYGLDLLVNHELFQLQTGVYEGLGQEWLILEQDPALDVGARLVLTPRVTGLEIGADLMSVSLPEDGRDLGAYPDTVGAEYQSNSGLAFGFDADYHREFGDMMLWAPKSGDTWKDYEWYKFQYYYLKAVFRITKGFGIHFGYSVWDPNTDGDKDTTTKTTPGIVYYWSKKTRTQVEVQMFSYERGPDEDKDDRTHFVLQQVFSWP